ncbi:hypothetical protein U9M48_013280, partial [Paspalum notatum var. saurae]
TPYPRSGESPVIEEPKTRNPSCSKKSTRRPHPTSPPRKLTLARKVWSSSSRARVGGGASLSSGVTGVMSWHGGDIGGRDVTHLPHLFWFKHDLWS